MSDAVQERVRQVLRWNGDGRIFSLFKADPTPHQLHCQAHREMPLFSKGCSCRFKFRHPGDKFNDHLPPHYR